MVSTKSQIQGIPALSFCNVGGALLSAGLAVSTIGPVQAHGGGALPVSPILPLSHMTQAHNLATHSTHTWQTLAGHSSATTKHTLSPNHQTPLLTTTPVTLSNGVTLDLTSAATNITLGDKLVPPGQSVTILVGGAVKHFYAGSTVTAAEYVAIKEVVAGGSQTLTINTQGCATAGTINLGGLASGGQVLRARELVVAPGVTAIDTTASGTGTIKITGELINYGTIDVLSAGSSTSNTAASAQIKAADIINESGGVITSVASSTSGNTSTSSLNLTLSSVKNFSNYGTVDSSGSLAINAGGTLTNAPSATLQAIHDVSLSLGNGNLVNGGSVLSSAGNINISAPLSSTNIAINSTGGSFKAQADINIRDASYAGGGNISLNGGNYLSQTLNLYSGNGTITGSVGTVSGIVNNFASTEHLIADTANLQIGNSKVNGDPTYYNTNGNITIAGNIAVQEDLTIIASGDITSSTGVNLTAQNAGGVGQTITLVAGAKITTASGGSSQTSLGPISGPPYTDNGSVTISGASKSGGQVVLASGSEITTEGNNANNTGGAVTIVAFGGGTSSTSGNIDLSGTQIFTGGAGSGASGAVTIIGGSASNGININSINTANGVGAGAAINVSAAAAVTSNGKTIDYGSNGAVSSGNSFKAGQAVTSTNSSITVSTGGQIEGASVVLSAPNITLNSGCSLTANTIVLETSNVTNQGTISTNAGGMLAIDNNNASVNGGNLTISANSAGVWNLTAAGGVTSSVSVSAVGNLDFGGLIVNSNDHFQTNGGNFLAVAGGDVTASVTGPNGNGILQTAPSGTGNSGTVTMVAGAAYTFSPASPSTLTVTGASKQTISGEVNFLDNGTGNSFSIDTSNTSGGASGQVTLAAFAITNNANAGQIFFNPASTITTTTTGTNGNVLAIAGNQVAISSINTGSNGAVTLVGANPALKAGGAVFTNGTNNSAFSAGAFNSQGMVVQNGFAPITTGSLTIIAGPLGTSIDESTNGTSPINLSVTTSGSAQLTNIGQVNIMNSSAGLYQLQTTPDSNNNEQIMVVSGQTLSSPTVELISGSGAGAAGIGSGGSPGMPAIKGYLINLTANGTTGDISVFTGALAVNGTASITASAPGNVTINNTGNVNVMTASAANNILIVTTPDAAGNGLLTVGGLSANSVILSATNSASGLGGIQATSFINSPSLMLTTNGGDIGLQSQYVSTNATNLTFTSFDGSSSSYGDVFISSTAATPVTISSSTGNNVYLTAPSLSTAGGGTTINAVGSLNISTDSLIVQNGDSLIGNAVNISGITANTSLPMVVNNAGIIQSTGANYLNIASAVGQSLQITGGGTISALSGQNINVTATGNPIDPRNNNIEFAGSQTFAFTGTSQSGNVNFLASGGPSSQILIDGGAIVSFNMSNSPVTLASPAVNINGVLALNNPPTYSGNTLKIVSPYSAGILENSQGNLDLAQFGSLAFNGQNLAIIASGNIIDSASGTSTINLSANGSDGLTEGGNLVIIAGYNFSESSIAGVDTYTLGSVSATGGSINLGNVNVNTSTTVSGSNGGSVLVVAAGAAGGNSGAISLGTITTTSAGILTTGGSVTLIGQGGVSAGAITTVGTAGTSGGAILATAATPIVNGSPAIQQSLITAGSFSAGSTGGNIQLSGASAGAAIVSLATGQAGNITSSSPINAGSLVIGLGSGSAGSLLSPLAANVMNISATGSDNNAGSVYLTNNVAQIAVENTSIGTFSLSAGNMAAVVQILGGSTSAHNFSIVTAGTSGEIVALAPTNTLSVVPGPSGDGGTLTLTASSITNETGVLLTLAANSTSSTTGNGGSINLNLTGGGTSTFDGATNLALSATGVNGGAISITTPGTLSLFTDGSGNILPAAINVNPASASGNGGHLSLSANAIEWGTNGTSQVTALNVSANGGASGGNGGAVSVVLTGSQSQPAVIGTGAGDFNLQATGVNGGSVTFSSSGTVGIVTNAGTGTPTGINVAPTAGGTMGTGTGGSINLTANTFTWGTDAGGTNAQTALKIYADGFSGGTLGAGGSISLNQTGTASLNLNNQIYLEAIGSNGGTVSVVDGGTMNITTGGSNLPVSFDVVPLAAGGNGGSIYLTAASFQNAGTGPVAINADGESGGLAGFIGITQTGKGVLTVGTGNNQFTLSAQGGENSGLPNGSGVLIDSSATVSVSPSAISVSGGENVIIASNSATALNYGLSVKNSNGVFGNITTTDSKALGILALYNFGGSVTNSIAITSGVDNLIMTGQTGVAVAQNIATADSITLSVLGSGVISAAKSITTDTLNVYSAGKSLSTGTLAFSATNVYAAAPNGSVALNDILSSGTISVGTFTGESGPAGSALIAQPGSSAATNFALTSAASIGSNAGADVSAGKSVTFTAAKGSIDLDGTIGASSATGSVVLTALNNVTTQSITATTAITEKATSSTSSTDLQTGEVYASAGTVSISAGSGGIGAGSGTDITGGKSVTLAASNNGNVSVDSVGSFVTYSTASVKITGATISSSGEIDGSSITITDAAKNGPTLVLNNINAPGGKVAITDGGPLAVGDINVSAAANQGAKPNGGTVSITAAGVIAGNISANGLDDYGGKGGTITITATGAGSILTGTISANGGRGKDGAPGTPADGASGGKGGGGPMAGSGGNGGTGGSALGQIDGGKNNVDTAVSQGGEGGAGGVSGGSGPVPGQPGQSGGPGSASGGEGGASGTTTGSSSSGEAGQAGGKGNFGSLGLLGTAGGAGGTITLKAGGQVTTSDISATGGAGGGGGNGGSSGGGGSGGGGGGGGNNGHEGGAGGAGGGGAEGASGQPGAFGGKGGTVAITAGTTVATGNVTVQGGTGGNGGDAGDGGDGGAGGAGGQGQGGTPHLGTLIDAESGARINVSSGGDGGVGGTGGNGGNGGEGGTGGNGVAGGAGGNITIKAATAISTGTINVQGGTGGNGGKGGAGGKAGAGGDAGSGGDGAGGYPAGGDGGEGGKGGNGGNGGNGGKGGNAGTGGAAGSFKTTMTTGTPTTGTVTQGQGSAGIPGAGGEAGDAAAAKGGQAGQGGGGGLPRFRFDNSGGTINGHSGPFYKPGSEGAPGSPGGPGEKGENGEEGQAGASGSGGIGGAHNGLVKAFNVVAGDSSAGLNGSGSNSLSNDGLSSGSSGQQNGSNPSTYNSNSSLAANSSSVSNAYGTYSIVVGSNLIGSVANSAAIEASICQSTYLQVLSNLPAVSEDNSYMVSETGPTAQVTEVALCSDTDLGLQKAGFSSIACDANVKLQRGKAVFAPSKDTIVETALGAVHVGAGSVVLISATPNKLAVFDLHDWKSSAVMIKSFGQQFRMNPGCHITVATSHSGEFAQLNDFESIAHRKLTSFVVSSGVRIYRSEFSLPSAMASIAPLQSMACTRHPCGRRVGNALVKTCAILQSLDSSRVGGNEGYNHYFKTSFVAMNNNPFYFTADQKSGNIAGAF